MNDPGAGSDVISMTLVLICKAIIILGYALDSSIPYMLCFGLWPPRMLDEI